MQLSVTRFKNIEGKSQLGVVKRGAIKQASRIVKIVIPDVPATYQRTWSIILIKFDNLMHE